MASWRRVLAALALAFLTAAVSLAQSNDQAGGKLEFNSAAEGMNASIGPVEFADGTYRVEITTTSRAIVSLRPLSGSCGTASLFDLSPGVAANGATTFFVAQACKARIVVNGASAAWKLVFEPVDASLALSVTPTLTPSVTPMPAATATRRPTSTPAAIPFSGEDEFYSGYDFPSNTIGPLELPAGRYYLVLSIEGPATVELEPVTGTCGLTVLFDYQPGKPHESTSGVDYVSQGCVALIHFSNLTDEGWGFSINPRFIDPTVDPLLTPTAMRFGGNELEFSGTDLPANPVLGPIVFPKGNYRTLLTTSGSLTVDLRPISGVCAAGNLFDVSAGDSSDQYHGEFRSEGCTAMVAVSNMTTEIWILDFYGTFDPTPAPGGPAAATSYAFDSAHEGLQGLVGPLELPPGSYRVTLTTNGYLSVSLTALTGYCRGVDLYHLSQDDVNLTTEALIQSDGCNAMISIGNSGGEPWSMTIEPIDSDAAVTPRPSPTVSPRDARPTATPAARDSGSHSRERGQATAAPTSTAPAISLSPDCDPAELRTWLTAQRDALEETAATVRAAGGQESSLGSVSTVLRQLSQVEALPLPTCAARAMNWTYAVYALWIESAACQLENSAGCRASIEQQANAAIDQAAEVFDPLLAAAGIDSAGWLPISADDFLPADSAVMAPSPTFTPTAAPPRKSSPHDRTPTGGMNGLFPDAPEARVLREALDASQFRRRIRIVEVVDSEREPQLRDRLDGRAVVVILSVNAEQRADYETDSILVMETVGSIISSRQFDLHYLLLIAYDPATTEFTKASLVPVRAILDYQAGRITRDELLGSIEIIDDSTLPQV